MLGLSWTVLGPSRAILAGLCATLASFRGHLEAPRVITLPVSSHRISVFPSLGTSVSRTSSSLVSVSLLPYSPIWVYQYLDISVSRYLTIFTSSNILEMRFQALRLATVISVPRHLYEFGHLGDMLSSFEAKYLDLGIAISLWFRPSWKHGFRL